MELYDVEWVVLVVFGMIPHKWAASLGLNCLLASLATFRSLLGWERSEVHDVVHPASNPRWATRSFQISYVYTTPRYCPEKPVWLGFCSSPLPRSFERNVVALVDFVPYLTRAGSLAPPRS